MPDLARYSVKDWRDGFPFWNEAAGEFWMLVTASLKDGSAGRLQWGGHGLMREIWQDEAGYLWPKCAPERLELGRSVPAPVWQTQLGEWSLEGDSAAAAQNWGLSYAAVRPLPADR